MTTPTPRILGCPCLPFTSVDDAKSALARLVESGKGGVAVAINAEKVMRYQEDPALRTVIDGAALPTPDGAGAVLGLRALHGVDSIKLNMPIAALEAADEGRWRVFVAGATEEVNVGAVDVIRKRWPHIVIVGRHHGFAGPEAIQAAIAETHPQVVLLALGSPRQELLAARIVEQTPTVVIGCGGALDALIGQVPRAPDFFVEHHLEWLYRLAQNPSRWRRQTALPHFAAAVAREVVVHRWGRR
jgi:N-acetylglucosaminyldiphosphoundecaprenol N-acetyl-beta-D-mannosaminyltransferase